MKRNSKEARIIPLALMSASMLVFAGGFFSPVLASDSMTPIPDTAVNMAETLKATPGANTIVAPAKSDRVSNPIEAVFETEKTPILKETENRIVTDLSPGEERVAREGSDGEKVTVFKVYQKDGKTVREEVLTTEIPPVSRIIEKGAENVPEVTPTAEQDFSYAPNVGSGIYGADGLIQMTASDRAQQAINLLLGIPGHANGSAYHVSTGLDSLIDSLSVSEAFYVIHRIEGAGFGQTGDGYAGFDTAASHQNFINRQVNGRFNGSVHTLLKKWGTYSYGGY